MNLNEKIGIAAKAIESISRHDDEDAGVRLVALERVEQIIAAERLAINDRVRSRIDELMPAASKRAGA